MKARLALALVSLLLGLILLIVLFVESPSDPPVLPPNQVGLYFWPPSEGFGEIPLHRFPWALVGKDISPADPETPVEPPEADWLPAHQLSSGDSKLIGPVEITLHGYGPSPTAWLDSGLVLLTLSLHFPGVPRDRRVILWEYRGEDPPHFSGPISQTYPVDEGGGLVLSYDLVSRNDSPRQANEADRFEVGSEKLHLTTGDEEGRPRLRRGLYLLLTGREEEAPSLAGDGEASPGRPYLLISIDRRGPWSVDSPPSEPRK